MHVQLLYVGILWGSIWFGGESDEAVVVKEDSKRVAGSDEDVNAEIELETVDQKRLVAVFLHDHVVVLRNLGIQRGCGNFRVVSSWK